MCVCDTGHNFIDGKGASCGSHNTRILEVFAKYKILLTYLAVINFIAFAAYAVDKVNAAEHRSRIRIVTLLGLAFVGCSIGSLLEICLFRHKTKKVYFTVGVPLIMIMQVVVIFLCNECRMVIRYTF